jgi:biopolymer transport protein ExbD
VNFQRERRNEAPEINLIPLIDVMLVLIIFLVLTTSYSKVAGLEINLPTAESAGAEATPNEVIVAVSAAGDVIVNRVPVGSRDINLIATALGKAASPGAKDPVVVINADAKSPHQSVIDVMQAAQRAGLPHITFATQAPQ